MAKTLDVFYDGKVFRPETRPDIASDRRYRIVIGEAGMRAEGDDVWSFLASLAGSIDAPEDWSAEHDRWRL